jgi:hypothetical protein
MQLWIDGKNIETTVDQYIKSIYAPRMKTSSVYETTYRCYLAQMTDTRIARLTNLPGVLAEERGIVLPLFGRHYHISQYSITDSSGKQPDFDICVMLSKFVLLSPAHIPTDSDWVTFRGLKDSGPLTVYFSDNVERAIASRFSGNIGELQAATRQLGGYPPEMLVHYDLSIQLDALPRLPVILLFNDKDDEFPATCSLLFERRAEAFLDPECLAMMGRLLYSWLSHGETF